MKQKRKVKSLIPQKNDGRGIFLTLLLLVLGLVMCLGSASLMTTMAAGASSDHKLSYTGVDDKVEVLYDLKFGKPSNLKNIVTSMFTKENNDFYLKSSLPLVVNSEDFGSNNEVSTGLHSNIFGGKENKILSGDNITIIGGKGLKVAGKNSDNSVIMGGKDNALSGSSNGGIPAVMIGGENNNVASENNGVVVIGGKKQKVNGSGAENVILIGGDTVTVGKNVKNVIVAGGKNVTINNGLQNIFVFSNSSSFVPQTSGTFYLDVSKGLGINTSINNRGVAVNGPIKIGDVDINKTCDSTNYGLIGTWNVGGGLSCLVACTPRSASKWDLLDQGDKCVKACDDNQSRCYMATYVGTTASDFIGVCTSGVDVTHAGACTPDVWDKYKNVFFETSLIDAEDVYGKCPTNPQNKCIFQCTTGYHLTGDLTQSTSLGSRAGSTGCFSDCFYKWVDVDKPQVYRHNQTVDGYNTETVYCSHDRYLSYGNKDSWIDGGGNGLGRGLSSWLNTINNNEWAQRPWKAGHDVNKLYYLDDGYGMRKSNGRLFGTERVAGWVGNTPSYREDYTNYRYLLPEHCGNNAHKVRLVCVDGTMYLAGEDGQKATVYEAKNSASIDLGYAHSGYVFFNCKLEGGLVDGEATHEYKCDLGQYNLTRSNIINNLAEPATGLDNQKLDRFEMKGLRGTYRLCVDYKVETQRGTDKKYNMHNPGNENCIVDYHSMNNSNSTKPYYEGHYQFLGCNDGYYRSTRPEDVSKEALDHSYYVCRKSCNIPVIENNKRTTKIVRDNSSIILFKKPEKTCFNGLDYLCDGKTFTCYDGVVKDDNGTVVNNNNFGGYEYTSCKQKGNSCPSNYKATQSDVDTYFEHSIYSTPCQWIYATKPYESKKELDTKHDYIGFPGTIYDGWWSNWNQPESPLPVEDCTAGEVLYHLEECDACYHDNNNEGEYCVKDYIEEDCAYDSNYTNVAGAVVKEWNGSRFVDIGKCEYYNNYEKDNNCGTDEFWNGYTCEDNPESDLIQYEYNGTLYATGIEEIEGLLEISSSGTVYEDDAVWTYYRGRYITGDEAGHNSGDIVEAYHFENCDDGYYQLGYKCKLIKHACRGLLPKYAEYAGRSYLDDGTEAWDGTTAYTDDLDVWEYYYDEYGEGGDCSFDCIEDYMWSDEFSACVPVDCDETKWTVRYDGSGGYVKWAGGTGLKYKQTVDKGGSLNVPTAERDCYTFLGWVDQSQNPVLNPSVTSFTPTRSRNLYADWKRICPYYCVGDAPSGEVAEKSTENPDRDGVQWKPVTDINQVLGPCEFRCKPGYAVTSDNKCVEKECKSHATNVGQKAPGQYTIPGKETYVGTNDKYWTYDTNLGECKWKCEDGYVRAKTGSTWLNYCEAKKCGGTLPTWNHVLTGASEYTGTDKNWKPVTGTTVLGPCEWTCEGGWLPRGNSCIQSVDAVCDNKHIPTSNGQTTGCSGGTVTGLNPSVVEGNSHLVRWSCKSTSNDNVTEGCFNCQSGWTGENCDLKIVDGKCVNGQERNKCDPGSSTGEQTIENTLTHKHTWNCEGENGGKMDVGCHTCVSGWEGPNCGDEIVTRIDGKCGSEVFGCYPGNPINLQTGNKNDPYWRWDCEGKNEGTTMTGCSAKFPEYTIRYEANEMAIGDPSKDVKVDSGLYYHVEYPLRASTTFIRTGYDFVRWNTKPDNSGTGYNAGFKGKNFGDITLYAISKCAEGWTGRNGVCEELHECSLIYKLNGGTLGGLNTKVDKGWCGTQFTRPSTDPTYTCNTFSGWYTTSGYTSLFNWSNTIDVNPTYVYAKWNPNEYTITYNCDEGVGNPGSQKVTYRVAPTPTITPTGSCSITGGEFRGWSTSQNSTTATRTNGSTMSGSLVNSCNNTTLYAVYEMYVCQGGIPTHSTGWNTTIPNTSTTPWTYSASSTSDACKFHCNTGDAYYWSGTAIGIWTDGKSHTGNCLKRVCNHCVENGFPYCFPIDYSVNCNEDVYL